MGERAVSAEHAPPADHRAAGEHGDAAEEHDLPDADADDEQLDRSVLRRKQEIGATGEQDAGKHPFAGFQNGDIGHATGPAAVERRKPAQSGSITAGYTGESQRGATPAAGLRWGRGSLVSRAVASAHCVA